ncbi:hypothetical protein [Parathalassolituus penaei]|mgnify:CR=1 FL=1|uniref:DUF58 domain-containing protein n=1 Tax=Parathalassolituus penaei TaxID=2997323 RepID=A0A9X3EAP2_9GAMM|nr:hypothetical protein [Parathalassolituus penaei]MCY0963656.1 hypothetical protein [Parathalassolituus penaei]
MTGHFSVKTAIRLWSLPLAVLLMGLAALAMATTSGSASAALLSSLLLSTLAVAWWLPLLQTRQLQVDIRQINQPEEGDELLLECHFHCNRTLYGIELELQIPELSRQLFEIDRIEPDSRLIIRVPASRCGLFIINSMAISSDWPFGLFRRQQVSDNAAPGLLVLPKVVPIRQLPLKSEPLPAYQQPALANAIGDDWFGIQHAAQTTPARRTTHHPLPQRYPQTSLQYDRETLPEYIIVLDYQQTVQGISRHSLDFRRSIAASIMACANRGEAIVHLFSNDRYNSRLTLDPYQQNPSFLSAMSAMSAMSAQSGDSGDSAEQLAERALIEFPQATLISLRAVEQTSKLRNNGRWLDIRIHNASFINPMEIYSEGWQTPEPNHRILTLHANSNFARFIQNANAA